MLHHKYNLSGAFSVYIWLIYPFDFNDFLKSCLHVSPSFPTGLPMSDQYVKLEEERRQKERAEKKKKEKKKRKEKRSGRGKRHDSGPESEEDITPAHMVDIVTEEMPEVSSELNSR